MSYNFAIAGGTKGIGLEIVKRLAPSAARIQVYARNCSSSSVSSHSGPVANSVENAASGNGAGAADFGRQLEPNGEGSELTFLSNVQVQTQDFLADSLELVGLPDVLHGVVYCPGSINLRSFRSLKPEDFRRDWDVNFLGAVKFLQACLPALKRGASDGLSSVVLFSTVAVGRGMTMHSSIAAAKGAVEGLTRSLAAEWAPATRVNCLAPALTDTPLAARFFETPENRQAMNAKYPLGRTGTPSDLASAATFLLHPDSNWVTGQVWGIDGGMSTLLK